ncbi:hypothetical protein D3C80_518770 [compost metagenome]
MFSSLWAVIRGAIGLRTPEEEIEDGRQYVRDQVRKHGIGNTHEMNRLWAECDTGGIDPTGFDKGMCLQLDTYDIPHPNNPLC